MGSWCFSSLLLVRLLLHVFSLAVHCSSCPPTTIDACPSPCTCTSSSIRPAISARELIKASPLYSVVSNVALGQDQFLNNCDTFFPIDGYTYMNIRSQIGKDYSRTVIKSLINGTSDPTQPFEVAVMAPGLRSGAGGGVVFNVSCPGSYSSVYNVYRYNNFINCTVAADCGIIFATSSSPNPSSTCVDQAVANLNATCKAIGNCNFFQYPNSVDFQCITSVNGLPAINANKVDRRYQYSLNYDDC